MKTLTPRECQQGTSRSFLVFSPDSALESLPTFQVIQRDMTDPGEIIRRLSSVNFAGILAERHI